MQISIKGKQVDVGDALRQHIETQISDIVGKYFSDTIDAHVTVSREAHLFRADIVVHAGRGITLQSNASASEPYPAFDAAAQRMGKRLRRHKTRLKHHHQDISPKEEALLAQVSVLHADDDSHEEANDNPTIVAEMTTPIETLSVSEAVMRLDLGDLPALLFRSRSHGGLNMIYRRADGHIGWVDPAQSVSESAPAVGQDQVSKQAAR